MYLLNSQYIHAFPSGPRFGGQTDLKDGQPFPLGPKDVSKGADSVSSVGPDRAGTPR